MAVCRKSVIFEKHRAVLLGCCNRKVGFALEPSTSTTFKNRRQHDCGSLLWTDLTYGSTSGVREGGQEAESHEVSFVLELRVLVGFVAGGGPAGGTGCSWKGGEQAR